MACLDCVIPLDERNLRRFIDECIEHYHIDRPHQGLNIERIERPNPGNCAAGPVQRRYELGRLLLSYHREQSSAE